jgi:hypothetical protein
VLQFAPVKFPEKINAHAFLTIDGRLSTEANVLTQASIDFLENARHEMKGPNIDEQERDLRRSVAVMAAHIYATRQLFPGALPLLAAIDASLNAGVWHGSGRLFLRVMSWLGWKWAKRYMPETRPGWNDYAMMYWFITGDPEPLHEIYETAANLPPVPSEAETLKHETAIWLVTSVRGRHPDFDAEITALEQIDGARIGGGELPGPRRVVPLVRGYTTVTGAPGTRKPTA